MSAMLTTIAGNVAQPVRLQKFDDGNLVATFTVAVNDGYFNRETGKYVEKDCEFVRVQIRRKSLARNVHASFKVGDPVMAHGKLGTHQWKGANDREFYTLVLYADNCGPNLLYGATRYYKQNTTPPINPETGEIMVGGSDTTATEEGVVFPPDEGSPLDSPSLGSPSMNSPSSANGAGAEHSPSADQAGDDKHEFEPAPAPF